MVKNIGTQNINNAVTSNFNIISLSSRFHDLKVLVTGLFDILVKAEAKLGNTFPVSQFHIHGMPTPFR